MQSQTLIYHHENVELQAQWFATEESSSPKPAILIAHDWSGRGEFALDKAKRMAAKGYIGVAIDMYGKAQIGHSTEENQALMQPLMDDRALLVARMQAALTAVKALANVDENKVACIGFCFGGLCALDLARSGADFRAAISVHGLLFPPTEVADRYKASILALHGYADPMVPIEVANDFCAEMQKHCDDFQLHIYGQTQHAFTNELANDEELGTVYQATSAARAWQTIDNYLSELFG